MSIDTLKCTISGTPTAVQSATDYTITASNDYYSTTATISITVNLSSTANLTYPNSGSYTFTKGLAILPVTPTITGTITSCTSSSALPTGLNIDNLTCAITGTPSLEQIATTYTITAANGYGSTTATISIAVNILAPSNLTYIGSTFTFTKGLTISISSPTYIGTITSCTSSPPLPAGLILNNLTCEITGTPSALSITFLNYTITAANSYGFTPKVISIRVIDQPPIVTYNPLYTVNNGATINIVPTLSGGAPTSCTFVSSPMGLSIDNTTCAISGTLNVTSQPYSFLVSVSNSGGSVNPYLGFDIDVTDCYLWGCLYDNSNDGTVRFEGIAGTFGGYAYTAQILYFMKCSQGQTWNSVTKTCDGAIGGYTFCSTSTNDCNGGNTSLELGAFTSSATSQAYDTCNGLNTNPTGGYAGKTGWRVPTKNELKLILQCSEHSFLYST